MKNNRMMKDIMESPTSFLVVGERPSNRYLRDVNILHVVLGR